MSDPPSDIELSRLLAALAEGAKAVQGLPMGDDFSFAASLPEHQSLLQQTSQQLWQTLSLCVQELQQSDMKDIQDPLMWEWCADTCDALLQDVEAHLEAQPTSTLQHLSQVARQSHRFKLQQLREGTDSSMQKPQLTYHIRVHNARTDPFVPRLVNKPHSVVPLDKSLVQGHGLTMKFIPDDIIAPLYHVPHPYAAELEQLEYLPQQLVIPEASLPPLTEATTLEATWIDTPAQLDDLIQLLCQEKEIALDLEAHSYHCFAGMTCLMQITTRTQGSYLVDTLKLFHDIPKLLPVLANPRILKVMHGADSDVLWLQRDFGLYIVNLFDTGRAARCLNKPAGLAHLLSHYVKIAANKAFQLADWRQRPLTPDMRHYAIQDTFYLLDIYDRLKVDLESTDNVLEVLEGSRKVCLNRYAGEPFAPSGYQRLISRQRTLQITPLQEERLKRLWDWRDATARLEDESTLAVLANDQLMRLSLVGPTSVAALQNMFSPIPSLLLKYAADVLTLLKDVAPSDEEMDEDADDELAAPVGASSSAFFKPSTEDQNRRRGMMSPVLGTEALYKQAGWLTPSEQIASDEEEDDDDPALLSVASSNRGFKSVGYADHSIDITEGVGRSRSVDGTATVRASREGSISPIIEEEQAIAMSSAARIRSQKDFIPSVLGFASPTNEGSEAELMEALDARRAETTVASEETEEELPIPRSMREIYKISNRNRRNKKTGSPTPERGVTPTDEQEREELAKAEALLREKGLIGPGSYFEDTGSPKRPRTKSRTGRESEESVPQDTSSVGSNKEDDLAFFKEIGYVGQEETLSSMMNKQQYLGIYAAPAAKPNPAIGIFQSSSSSNPFFAGAAASGGVLTHGTKSDKSKKSQGASAAAGNKGRSKNKQREAPQKGGDRSHAYRKR